MFCYNCGKEIDDNANFCRFCGAKQDEQNENNETSQANDIEENNETLSEPSEYSTEVSENIEDVEKVNYNESITFSEQITHIKNSIVSFFKKYKKAWCIVLISLPILLLLVAIVLYISVINSYNSALKLQETNQHEEAYKKIQYVHMLVPNYKDTKKIYDTCNFIHNYTMGTNTSINDYNKEIYLKKALETEFAKNSVYYTKIVNGLLYNIWYRRALIMANIDYQKSDLSYAIKHINEAKFYLNLAKKNIIFKDKQNQENTRIYIVEQEKHLNDVVSMIKKSKDTILNLNSYMKFVKDDFEKTLQIYDRTLSDAFWDIDDFIYLDIVQYKNDIKPKLYLMIIHKQNLSNANELKFNIDGNVRTLYLTSPITTELFKKYQVSCDEELVNAILKGKKVQIRLSNNDRNYDRTINQNEINAIKRTYDYFNLFARYGNIEERIKELKNSESFDRYVKMSLPNKYLAEQQIPNSEFTYTVKWDLFNIYKFQKMNSKQRISEFEYDGEIYSISSILSSYVDRNQIYKIADNYCIKAKEMDNGTYKYDDLQRITCSDDAVGIENLPYKKCKWFTRKDKDGEYYVVYDIKALWNEFDKKGIDRIEKEIGTEINDYLKEHNITEDILYRN